MSNRNKKAQQAVIEDKLHDMLVWYLANSSGKTPDHIAEDTKPYRDIKAWWYEPLLPGLDNPVLIQEQLGDSWTLRMELRPNTVSIVTP